jgi:general secretion pathway protein A
MYKRFYGLRDNPFSLAPDPKYLFRTESLLEVLANLQYGIENGKGLVVVTGEVGTGKTTVLRSVMQSLDRSVLAAYIFNPLLSTPEFFELLASECRLRGGQSKSAILRLLGYLLMTRHSQGTRTVLIVDEAHLLPRHLLEEIRLLSNFETNREKLLQVILCGQPELHDVLSQPELRQLKQRVSLRSSIKPLDAHETGEYIRWRLRLAGARDENLFEPVAVGLVYQFSGGIPRLINNICDNALLTAFGKSSPRVAAATVREVVEELDLSPIEVGRVPTASECALEVSNAGEASSDSAPVSLRRDSSEHDQPGVPKVRPIRRSAIQSPDGAEVHDSAPLKFVLNRQKESGPEMPRFFARVRVSRSS